VENNLNNLHSLNDNKFILDCKIIISSFFYNPFIFIRKYSTTGTRLSKLERLLIKIPPKVGDILIGIMLGDAHIQRRSPTAIVD
jgi:hypothetical protein